MDGALRCCGVNERLVFVGRLVLVLEFERTLELAEPFAPDCAQDGRSERLRLAAELLELFAGLLPKPCGARPRSTELPWASKLREPLLFGRFCENRPWRPEFAEAEPERFMFAPRSLASRVLLPALTERTGMCEAPAAGLLRATTERF